MITQPRFRPFGGRVRRKVPPIWVEGTEKTKPQIYALSSHSHGVKSVSVVRGQGLYIGECRSTVSVWGRFNQGVKPLYRRPSGSLSGE
jgi:hypothetical protein